MRLLCGCDDRVLRQRTVTSFACLSSTARGRQNHNGSASDGGRYLHTSERLRELGEDREVGVQPHALDSPHAQGQERPLVLEPAELALDRAARAVQIARPLYPPPLRVETAERWPHDASGSE